jgi:hypothetical protein
MPAGQSFHDEDRGSSIWHRGRSRCPWRRRSRGTNGNMVPIFRQTFPIQRGRDRTIAGGMDAIGGRHRAQLDDGIAKAAGNCCNDAGSACMVGRQPCHAKRRRAAAQCREIAGERWVFRVVRSERNQSERCWRSRPGHAGYLGRRRTDAGMDLAADTLGRQRGCGADRGAVTQDEAKQYHQRTCCPGRVLDGGFSRMCSPSAGKTCTP